MLAHIPFDSLTEDHILQLIASQASEKRTLEYKESLPADTYDARREFLADATSFANASGGHLLFGIQEEGGIPIAVPGLQLSDPHKEVLRLEHTIRDGVEPRLIGVSIRALPLSSGSYVLILRIPRSWSGPHVVNYRGHWRFYSRNSAGKYPLDTSELRQQFLQASTIQDKLRTFRNQRLGLIVADEAPVRLITGARTVLHIMPFSLIDAPNGISLEAASANPWALKPMYSSVTGHRYNLDGFLTYGGNEEGLARGYVQVFRNGGIEAVDSAMLRLRDGRPPFIPSVVFERELIQTTSTLLKLQQELAVPLPICVMLSLLGVKGFIMAVHHDLDVWGEHRYPIERDTLLLPEVVLETYPMDTAPPLRPVFDSVWNACGWPRSLGYSNEGEWGKGPNMRL
jgi:hypothetical protein